MSDLSILSPNFPKEEFPLSTEYVKTLVTAKITKVSEFSFELSIKEGDVIELDTELISNALKRAIMETGSLPIDWLPCITYNGEKRLIRKELVNRVEDTQGRMYQLKRVSEKLLDSMFYKKNHTAEIGRQIHVLMGTDIVLMKYFVDQLISTMKESKCHRMKIVAVHALNHYMENNELSVYIRSKVSFTSFIKDIISDKLCPPETMNYVYRMLEEWCAHFDADKEETSQILVDFKAEKVLNESLLVMIDSTEFFLHDKRRKALNEAVQRISRSYLQKNVRADRLVFFLLENIKKHIAAQDYEKVANCLELATFIFPSSSYFEGRFLGDEQIKMLWEEKNRIGRDGIVSKIFAAKIGASKPAEPQIERIILTKAGRPPIVPPKPKGLTVLKKIEVLPQPIQQALPKAVLLRNKNSIEPEVNVESVGIPLTPPKENWAENLLCSPSPVVRPRRVHEVKKGRAAAKNRFSMNSQLIINALEPFLSQFSIENLKTIRHISNKGGQGDVSLVEVKEFGLPVVAKIMKNGRGLTDNVENELANLLKCGHHPHIVMIHGKITSHLGSVGILMEFMEMGSIYDVIYNKREDYHERQLLIWMEHVANALIFLHSKGLVHRDIKPDNMLLTLRDGQRLLKLGDFGLMKAITEMDKVSGPSHIFGTPGYLAPECFFLQENGYNISADIYSFGISIWEMTQKLPPYCSENMTSYDVKDGEYSLRPKIDHPKYSWMPNLVTKMWQTDNSLRPNIEEVHENIKNLLDK